MTVLHVTIIQSASHVYRVKHCVNLVGRFKWFEMELGCVHTWTVLWAMSCVLLQLQSVKTIVFQDIITLILSLCVSSLLQLIAWCLSVSPYQRRSTACWQIAVVTCRVFLVDTPLLVPDYQLEGFLILHSTLPRSISNLPRYLLCFSFSMEIICFYFHWNIPKLLHNWTAQTLSKKNPKKPHTQSSRYSQANATNHKSLRIKQFLFTCTKDWRFHSVPS